MSQITATMMPPPDMASMANRGMGTMGRDYNIQLDKVEKYRREGTWTEADEIEWAKKKPFPCEICGDRVSSRANLNRHIKTRHYPHQEHDNKRFACDICGKVCKREDNVVKHKKQKHSIISHQPRQRRGSASMNHRFSWHGAGGFAGIMPEGGINWQDPRFTQVQEHVKPPKKQPKEPSSEEESESDSEIEGGRRERKASDGDMMNLTSDFGRKVYVAEDLPRQQVKGLKKYYTDYPILPQELLSHYADYYFNPPSTSFHSHLPLLHKPTFKTDTVLASFLRAICCIGGLYDPTDQTLGRQLWESGWKVMERWVEWGIGDDEDTEEEDSDNSLSKIKKEDQEIERMREEAEMGGTLTVEAESKKMASRRTRERRLCVMQAFLLFECFGVFSREREWHKKGRRIHARCVEIAREYGYFQDDISMVPTINKQEDPKGYLRQEWEIFVEKESRKRAAFCLYLLDCHLSLLFNIPPLLRPTELRNLSLPCDEDIFNASTPEEWDFTRRVRVYEPVPIMFLKTLRGILKGNINAVTQELNDFSCYILVVAVLIEITKISQKVAVEEDEVYDDGRPRIIVFMPPERQEDVERLDRAMSTLRTLSTQRDDFFERHIGVSSPYQPLNAYSPESNRSQALSDPTPNSVANLSGCTKCFYIFWHLSHVFLVVPDRLVLSGDVPIDMQGCLNMIVAETRTRLERDEEMDLSTLEGVISKLSPHLLAIMRFLENRTYDESRTEFPAIVALAFRACMVIWEIIVRVNFFSMGGMVQRGGGDGDSVIEERIGGNVLVGSLDGGHPGRNWSISGPSGGSGGGGHGGGGAGENHRSTTSLIGLSKSMSSSGILPGINGGNGNTVGEMFIGEVLECIHLPTTTDEMPQERAETRFLRWVQATFEEMASWDVGPEVSNAVEGIVEDWDALAQRVGHD
ncbi:hypothetical protein TWF569_011836 [Orbilia oligospora]|uniref:C2H2-type domain-containing protein n=1 Tax=Orbilia oligospora TaxID=2813651 RepID=A0A7C8JJS0_ORBOL|nr:hypothetical protein TWF706_002697 [Orbilia oligospora]KAF3080653.1 hypothetical protein TWF706_002697 [Orbilia oligospora]KAF3084155.1 hypothetical protein TWF103_002598 [Orbilia oligospora]KAF3099500.1 hypothetical protein TWF102_005473 [Orbilia oligospora]KAF3125767.1 hypothetical protein TWF594_001330 [Orbilia oligospora]